MRSCMNLSADDKTAEGVAWLAAARLRLGLGMHVRNTLDAAAADGARYGANGNRHPDDAVQRTKELISSALSPEYPAHVTARYAMVDGVRTLEVTVRADFPLVGFAGPPGAFVVNGHALVEQAT